MIDRLSDPPLDDFILRYAPDGVLLPTVSNVVRNTPEEIEDYFKYFLTLQPKGTIDEVGTCMYVW